MPKETYSTVKDIFSVGTWNGDKYTDEDLDDMVSSFDRLTKDGEGYRVPLKIDFFKDVKTKGHGGQPAVGWITKLTKVGNKIFANIENIPKKIKELIENKSYRQISVELFIKGKIGTEKLRMILSAVALLGVETPGVSNLDEFAAFFTLERSEFEGFKSFKGDETEESKICTVETKIIEEIKTMSMTEEEIKKLQDEKTKTDNEMAELNKKFAAIEVEKAELVKKSNEDKVKADELAASQRKAEIKTFVESKKVEGKILPAHEEAIINVMENLNDSVVVKFTKEDKSEGEQSIRKMFEGFIDSMPELIKFSEKANGGITEGFEAKDEATHGTKESQELDHNARKFMKENKDVDYRDALIAVSK